MSRTKGSKNLTGEQLIQKGEFLQQIGAHKKAGETLKQNSPLLKNNNNHVTKIGVGRNVRSTQGANGESSMVAEEGVVMDNPTNEQLAAMGGLAQRLLNNPQPPQLQSPKK